MNHPALISYHCWSQTSGPANHATMDTWLPQARIWSNHQFKWSSLCGRLFFRAAAYYADSDNNLPGWFVISKKVEAVSDLQSVRSFSFLEYFWRIFTLQSESVGKWWQALMGMAQRWYGKERAWKLAATPSIQLQLQHSNVLQPPNQLSPDVSFL
jgi:hypothetical protein